MSPLFSWGQTASPAVLTPEVMMVELAPPPPPPPPQQPEQKPQPKAEEPPQPPRQLDLKGETDRLTLPPAEGEVTGEVALEEVTEPKPQTPSPKTPAIVKKKSPAPQATVPEVVLEKKVTQAPPDPKVGNIYDMMRKTLGRDAQSLGRPGGTQTLPEVERYYRQVMAKFSSLWSPSDRPYAPDLQVGYTLVVEPDGRISDIRLNRSSGDANFDRAVAQTLRRASPLPPLPAYFGGRRDTPSFIFQPDRLSRRR